jgi:hypothetical protein
LNIETAIRVTVQLEADIDLLGKSLADVQTDTAVDLGDDYDPGQHRTLVDLASIEVLQCLINTPDITEGGLSIKYNRDAMKTRLIYLQDRQGLLVDSTPTVTDISNLW